MTQRPFYRATPILLCAAVLAWTALGSSPRAQTADTVKGRPITEFLSTGGTAAHQQLTRRGGLRRALAVTPDSPGGDADPGEGVIPDNELLSGLVVAPFEGADGGGRPGTPGMSAGRNVFVNDPCLDPPPFAPFPENFRRTVQSETEIAVLNRVPGAHGEGNDDDEDASGQLMVAGYNDSYGFYNNKEGLSGFSYSTDGGKTWIDGGGLPPLVPSTTDAGDRYFGDPVLVVHHRSKTFYYASIYQAVDGTFNLSVNRGHFKVAPPQGVESKANTRCASDPAKWGVPDPPGFIRKRIIWEPPVVAAAAIDPGDLLDKEWLYVDQRTGELYLVYVRFSGDGSGATPLELTRSFDGGRTWTAPSIILPNLDDTFNTGLSIVTTPTGRVVVSWSATTFLLSPPFPEISHRIESAYSDNDGVTFTAPVIATGVSPQGEPKGYNRRRSQILNVTYLAVDKGPYDGATGGRDEQAEDRDGSHRPGYGNLYLTYFDGKSAGSIIKAADVKLSVSVNGGATWRPPVKVNDDNTMTSHVFPSVQVNKFGTVFVTWIDRRVDPVNNILNDTWGAFSTNGGRCFAGNIRITDVSTDWIARADARPNFGDYNSSEVIDFDTFASIWSDARFPTPVPLTRTPTGGFTRPASGAATPDTLFAIVGNGLPFSRGGWNGDGDGGRDGDSPRCRP